MRRVNPSLYTKKYYLTNCSGYQEFKNTWGKELESRLRIIINRIPSVKGLRVLDIGCGRGELVFWSAINGAKKVVGIDYSKSAINLANEAKTKYNKDIKSKVSFKIFDAKDLSNLNSKYDAIFLVEILEHLYPEELIVLFKELGKCISKDGYIFVHTAPNKWFNDFTYKYWCYPISRIIIGINNITGKEYTNLTPPKEIRDYYHNIMHVNEPNYFSLKKLFSKFGFKGEIESTNVTVNKPIYSWKDATFNFLVYLYPLSKHFPFNVLWGNDFITILRKDVL